VPNMRNFPGWSDMGDAYGHGPRWTTAISIYLAEPFDPDSLVLDNLPVQHPLHARIPRERILDVLTSGATPDMQVGGLPYCPNFVDPSFDGQYAELVDGSMTHSIVRKPLAGWLLQRTKVSAADFEHAPPSPGSVP
jgi:hypothetical protein